MSNRFDIITYLANMTNFSFTRAQIEQIAMTRGISNVDNFADLKLRDRNLALADMLFLIFTSYSSTGGTTKSHNGFTLTIGASSIADKSDIYNLMTKLYKNPEQELNQVIISAKGGCNWVNED
jgi:hypothetical protein